MLYYLYDNRFRSLQPLRLWAKNLKRMMDTPMVSSKLSFWNKPIQASCEMIERLTDEFKKQDFMIDSIFVHNHKILITEEILVNKPFCRLIHFRKSCMDQNQPKILIVAPLSGHYATLVRDTVKALLQNHDVYVTDWVNARDVSVNQGKFNLETNIEYIIDFIKYLKGQVHLLAVCQPAVPVLAAVAILAQHKAAEQPLSMTLMGGPIDTRINPSKVNVFAKRHSLDWFKNHMITQVPFYYQGGGRKVYPGFLQLSGFLALNPSRHLKSHTQFFDDLVTDNHLAAERHRLFYNEYLSVMDMTEEFFLDTVEKVFLNHDLPKGTLVWKGERVDLGMIQKTALLTIEGESDDISPKGQTKAAHDLCPGIPSALKQHYLQQGVGHYGLFSGHHWRDTIMPEIRNFIQMIENRS